MHASPVWFFAVSASAAAAQSQQKLRLLIIGAGPSAFYSAARVLSHYNNSSSSGDGDVEVHMCERLPAPHGLVRYGVAPDHPEVKVRGLKVLGS